MRVCRSRAAGWFLAAALYVVFATPVALAQPAENCTGADLDGGDTFPGGVSTATTEDFTLCNPLPTGTTPDNVVCFRPTNNCSVSVGCIGLPDGPDWVHMLALVSGACTTDGTGCTLGAGGSQGATLANVALTAGQNYCFICSSTSPTRTFGITESSGDCGALPVELMLFEVKGP